MKFNEELRKMPLLKARLEAMEDLQLQILALTYGLLGGIPIVLSVLFWFTGFIFVARTLIFGDGPFVALAAGWMFCVGILSGSFAITASEVSSDTHYFRQSRTCPDCGTSENVPNDGALKVKCQHCGRENIFFDWEVPVRFVVGKLRHVIAIYLLLGIILSALAI